MGAGVDFSATKACRCLAARRYARTVTRIYERRLRPHGLRATQFSVLAALSLAGPTAVSDLATLLGLDRTTLSRVAGVLERNGWVGAGRTADGRTRPLRLTGAGRRKAETAFPAWKEAQESVERSVR